MSLRTAALVAALALGFGGAALDARAHAAGKGPSRIGFLAGSTDPVANAAFRDGLRELGYVEGHNLTIESRFAEGKAERLPALAMELVRLDVALIVAATTPAIRAAQQATRSIPIVMTVGEAADGSI